MTIDFGKPMGLEMSDEDVEKMVDKHGEELITEKMQDLPLEEQLTADEEEETGEENMPSSEIKGIFS